MVTTPSHHTFHRLSRLLTTFLAQMRHLPVPVETPVSVSEKQRGMNDRSTANNGATPPQGASESAVEIDAMQQETLEPALSLQSVEHDDSHSNPAFESKEELQEQFSDKSTAKYSTASPLRCKKAYMIINPRAGHNVTRIADVIAVLSAAGMKTGIAVKHYAGHAIELATWAARHDYDLVIAYGGDGTINHVVNGVMAARGKGRRKAIGVIPGGTINQWASETSVPLDPVKAALALIDSNIHPVDLGRLRVQSIKFPNQTQENRQKRQKARKRKANPPSSREHYFLLTAGLGIDASVISHTSKGLKQRIGPLAFDLAVAESLPEQHAFPIEVKIIQDGQDQPMVWRGDVYQVILGNTRRYANAIELTPDVYLDDDKLELCVITKGNAITTLQQMSSLLFKHKPDTFTAEHFLATHYLITVPASIHLHLDGSAVKLEDYLNKPDRQALRKEQHRDQIMVTYRFDAVPHALRTAIPRNYDNTLFEHAVRQEVISTDLQQRTEKDITKQHVISQRKSSELISQLQQQGYKVKVNGVVQVPNKRQTSIIAGSTVNQHTGETIPVAIRIAEDTAVLLQTGDHASLAHIQQLPDGAVVIAHGKKSKRGIIRAKHLVLPDF